MQKVDAHVISLANQKGGTAKTTTCANLGIGLAQAGTKIEKGSVLSTLITYRREAKPWQRKKKSKSQLYTSDYPETMNRLANRTPS